MPLKNKTEYNAYMKLYRRQIKEKKYKLRDDLSRGNPTQDNRKKHSVVVHRDRKIIKKRNIATDMQSGNPALPHENMPTHETQHYYERTGKLMTATLLDGTVIYLRRR